MSLTCHSLFTRGSREDELRALLASALAREAGVGAKNSSMAEANSMLQRESLRLGEELAMALTENTRLTLENKKMAAEIARLRAKPTLDSTNSSKPPSSDGLKKKNTNNLREKPDSSREDNPITKGTTWKRNIRPTTLRITNHRRAPAATVLREFRPRRRRRAKSMTFHHLQKSR